MQGSVVMDSAAAFRRSLAKRYEEVRKAIERVIQALASNNTAERKPAVQAAAGSTAELRLILNEVDRPRWLEALHSSLKAYSRNHDPSQAALMLINSLIQHSPAALSHRWDFSKIEHQPVVDFETRYRVAADNAGLDDLFDRLVVEITTIVESNEVDSVRALRALERLVNLIKANARKTYFAAHGMWRIARIYSKKLLWELPQEFPGVAAFVRAAQATVEEIDGTLSEVDKAMATEIEDVAEAMLTARVVPSLPQLGPGVTTDPEAMGSGSAEASPEHPPSDGVS